MARYWPGPLTLVLEAADRVPAGLTGGGSTIGVRMPGHAVARALVTAGGRVLGVQALGADVAAAIRTAYAAVERIRFDGAHYRRDIGHHALRRLG